MCAKLLMVMLAAAGLAAAGTAGCEDKKSPSGTGGGGSGIDNLRNQAGAVMDEAQKQAADAANTALTKVKGEIVQFRQTPNEFSGAAQEAWDNTVAELDAAHLKLMDKVTELKAAGKDGWQKVSGEFNEGLKKLQEQLKAAQDQYLKK